MSGFYAFKKRINFAKLGILVNNFIYNDNAIWPILFSEFIKKFQRVLAEKSFTMKSAGCKLKLIKIENQLSTKDVLQLSSEFKLAYILELSPSNFTSKGIAFDNSSFNKTFEKVVIDDKNSKVATDFFLDLFISKFSDLISNHEIELLRSKLNMFLANANSSFIFKSDNDIVGIFGASKEIHHPLLKRTVNHIGVVGYDNKKLKKEASTLLKKYWLLLIMSILENNFQTTARVDIYNKPSIDFFLSLGFKVSYLELTSIQH